MKKLFPVLLIVCVIGCALSCSAFADWCYHDSISQGAEGEYICDTCGLTLYVGYDGYDDPYEWYRSQESVWVDDDPGGDPGDDPGGDPGDDPWDDPGDQPEYGSLAWCELNGHDYYSDGGIVYAAVCPSCGFNSVEVDFYTNSLSMIPDNISMNCPHCGYVLTKQNVCSGNVELLECMSCGDRTVSIGDSWTPVFNVPDPDPEPAADGGDFASIASGIDYTIILSEVISVLPSVLAVVVMYIAIRKAIALLERFLHQS